MSEYIANKEGLPSCEDLVTILIPTKDRPYLLNRSLSYYAKIGFLTRFIIIDSSSSAFLAETKKVCEKWCDQLTIEYLCVDEDNEISNKIFLAADLVDTPYILWIGDDDFPLKSTINKLLVKLERDRSIVAAFGHRVAISQVNTKTSGFKWVKSYPNYSGISIVNNNALDRIRRLPIPVWQQYPNSIIRSDVLKKAVLKIRKLEYTQYSEFFMHSLILAHGKWIKFDMLFAVCHQESSLCSFKSRYLFPNYIGDGGSVLDGVSRDLWSRDVSLLCSVTASELLEIECKNLESVTLEIRKIYYSKVIYYLELNNMLSDNMIDASSSTLRMVNNIFRKLSRLYWAILLYDKSGGAYEFINFFFGVVREVLSGRLIKVVFNSVTSSSIIDFLISIKRTGSLDYESSSLLQNSSKYHQEYKVIFDIWTSDPCPQQLEKTLTKKDQGINQ
jgi:glycosyltransferase domain-containing protein